MTSPPFRVPAARQVWTLIVVFTNLTDPSAIVAFTPPGWRLLAVVSVSSGANIGTNQGITVSLPDRASYGVRVTTRF